LDGKTVSVHRTYYDYDGRKKKEVNPAMYNSMYDTGKDYIGTASAIYEYDVYGRVTKVTNNIDGISFQALLPNMNMMRKETSLARRTTASFSRSK